MSYAGGAGALYSTIGDLYRWNKAVFTGKVLADSSIKAAFTPVTLNNGNEATGISGGGYGYGWAISQKRGLKEISHGGGLHGFVSYLTRYPEQNMTIAVLANCAPTYPDLNPTPIANEIAQIYLWKQMESQKSYATDTSVDPTIYDDYVGRYEYPGDAIMTISKEDGRLFAQLTGQSRHEIFPRTETEFFWKVVDAQITFVRNKEGQVDHAIHHQKGQEFEVPKIEEETTVDVDPAILDKYTGEYELGPNQILTITRESNQLFAQMTGQPKFEIYPRSETSFFFKVVKADINFILNNGGEVTGVVLHQAGMELEAKKIK